MVWWMSAIKEIEEDANSAQHLPNRIQLELLQGTGGNKNVTSIANQFNNLVGLRFVLDREQRVRTERRKELLDHLL